MKHDSDLKDQVQKIILVAAAGALALDDLHKAKGVLMDAGYSSAAFTHLLVLLEEQFGISIPPTIDPEAFASVDSIVNFVEHTLKVTH